MVLPWDLPFDLHLANIFLCHYEKIWLDSCPKEFKQVYYSRYVDDIFALFSSPEHVERFRNYISCQHNNINFSSDVEANNSFSFLDVKSTRENGIFTTSVYRKPTFSGDFSNFTSFLP